MKEVVSTDKAPKAIGPYSQAIKAGGFLFMSGQIPLDPETMQIVPGCAACQTKQAVKNMQAVLESQGLTLDDVVKVTAFIKDMEDFSLINEAYGEFFTKDCPVRSCVEVARLPKDVLVEIEAIAAYK